MAKALTFRMDVTKFERDTSRLGPAVVGCYIRILLDYFEQGEAPPDEDSVLARIAGCDLEMWRQVRPKLEKLFTISERWFHNDTEAEIAAQNKRSARAKAASQGDGSVTGKAAPTAPIITTMVGADPAANRAAAAREQLAEQRIMSQIVDDAIDDDIEEDLPPEPPPPPPVGIAFERGLDPDFRPSAAEIASYMADGYDSDQIARVIDEFKRYNINMGTTSTNWPELWKRWWSRKKPPLHPAEKKPKPRVEVSRRAPAPPQEA